jgi:hypothetical protein
MLDAKALHPCLIMVNIKKSKSCWVGTRTAPNRTLPARSIASKEHRTDISKIEYTHK